MKSLSKRDWILIGIIAFSFTLIGVGIARLFTPKLADVDNSLIIKNDSLNRENRIKDKIIANRDSIVKSQSIRLVQRDSLYINLHIKSKHELKYLQSLDSTSRANRIDSLLKGAGIRK